MSKKRNARFHSSETPDSSMHNLLTTDSVIDHTVTCSDQKVLRIAQRMEHDVYEKRFHWLLEDERKSRRSRHVKITLPKVNF